MILPLLMLFPPPELTPTLHSYLATPLFHSRSNYSVSPSLSLSPPLATFRELTLSICKFVFLLELTQLVMTG